MSVQLISDAAMRSLVAHLPGVVDGVNDKAKERSGTAKTKLAAHRYSGNAKVTVTQGDVDSFVNLEDPAALSIEFGHFVKGKYERDEPKYVHGLYIITGT